MTAVAKAWRGRLGAVLLAWAVCGVLQQGDYCLDGRIHGQITLAPIIVG